MWTDDDRRYVSRDTLIKGLGRDAAARVVELFGGARIYIPSPDAEDFTPLARKLGDAVAQALCREFGGVRVDFPVRLTAKRTEILRLRQEHTNRSEIAQRVGVSERYVYYVLASAHDLEELP